jgi:hypothetical protein
MPGVGEGVGVLVVLAVGDAVDSVRVESEASLLVGLGVEAVTIGVRLGARVGSV